MGFSFLVFSPRSFPSNDAKLSYLVGKLRGRAGPKLIYPLSWFSVTPEPVLIGRSWLTRETREHFHAFE